MLKLSLELQPRFVSSKCAKEPEPSTMLPEKVKQVCDKIFANLLLMMKMVLDLEDKNVLKV